MAKLRRLLFGFGVGKAVITPDRVDPAFDQPVERLNRQHPGLFDQVVEIDGGPLLLGQELRVASHHIDMFTRHPTTGQRIEQTRHRFSSLRSGRFPSGLARTDHTISAGGLLSRRSPPGRGQFIRPDTDPGHQPIQAALHPSNLGHQHPQTRLLEPANIDTGHQPPKPPERRQQLGRRKL